MPSTSRSARRSSSEMVEITQRDLPYIVLTDDPNLQAYRTDTVENVEPACPAETGDILCEQIGYEPLLSITPAARRRLERRRRPVAGPARSSPRSCSGSAAGCWARARAGEPRARAAGAGPEREGRPMSGRWLAGKVGGGAADARLRHRLQLLPVPGDGRPDHPARPAAPGVAGGDREAEGRLRARQAAHRPVRRLRRRHAALDLGISQRQPRAGVGRDQGGAAVDAAAGRRSGRWWRP